MCAVSPSLIRHGLVSVERVVSISWASCVFYICCFVIVNMPVIYVLWPLRRRGPSSISVPNFKRIALFVQKVIRGSQNFEIWSRDPGHVVGRRYNTLTLLCECVICWCYWVTVCYCVTAAAWCRWIPRWTLRSIYSAVTWNSGAFQLHFSWSR